jgi:hypothetical protein
MQWLECLCVIYSEPMYARIRGYFLMPTNCKHEKLFALVLVNSIGFPFTVAMAF